MTQSVAIPKTVHTFFGRQKTHVIYGSSVMGREDQVVFKDYLEEELKVPNLSK